MATHTKDVRGLARSSTLNLFGGAATAVLTLGLTFVFTRGLGAGPAGVLFSSVALFQVVAAVAGLGAETGLVRFVAARRTDESIGLSGHRLWKIAFVPVLLFGVLVATGMLLAAGPIGASIGGPNYGADAAASLRIMSLFLPLAALSAALLGATRGYRTMRPTVVIDRVARPLFQVVVAWITTSLGAPMAITALGWASAYVGQMLFAWLWLENLEKNEPLTESVTPLREAVRTFWRFTLPRAAATSMRTALQWFDVVLVAALSTPEDAAVYTVCTRLLQLGMLAAFSVGQAVEPLFGESVAARESARTSELYKVATAWLMLMTWPIYFVLAAFAAPVLSVFGSGFASGATAVLVLVVSVLIGAAVGPADILLVMTGRTMWSLWNTAASLAANLALNIVLIPRLGLIGAAVAWTVGRTVANLLPAIQLWRSEEMHPVSRGWALAAGLSVGIFAVPSFAARFALGPSLLLAVGASALLTAGFLVAVRRFREPLALDLAVSALRRRIS